MKIRLISTYKPKLIFQKRVCYCQIGSNGIVSKYKKKEGDKSTPRGTWKLKKIYLRREEIFKLKINKIFQKKTIIIKNNDLWCDDPNSKLYNKFYKNKKNNKNLNFSYENLYRADDVYNFIIELSFNTQPILRGKGSAIFIHCSFSDLRPTAGCVAMNKNSLKFLISNLQKNNSIYIQ